MLSLFTTKLSWQILAVVFALLNLKSLPFVWHIRLLNAIFTHLTSGTRPRTPTALFQPIVISSRSPLLECDYNLHKSNSTYFADLDIARTHLLACLLKTGMDEAHASSKAKHRGHFGVMLGGVTCSFKREIRPYQAFEIWTRVLSWDRKWLYLASHFVEKGKVRPTRYTLQPRKRKDRHAPENIGLNKDIERVPHSAILASSIAKYVFKEGRLTIPPETILKRSGVLPSKPNDLDVAPPIASLPIEISSKEVAEGVMIQHYNSPSTDNAFNAVLEPPNNSEEWDWKQIEDERLRGLRIAESMIQLDLLHYEFTAETGPALGEY